MGLALEDEAGLPFASYFSGNTVQICPVGALTGAAYRFRSRPFDLVSTPSVAEHDSSGSAIRVDHRRGVVLRRLAGQDPLVNEEWITDRDRFAFTWQSAPDRLTHPLVRDREVAPDGTVTRGELRPASWAEALEVAADALTRARDAGGVGVLPGGRLTVEDAYAYAKLARTWLRTNDVDHRARAHSAEEADFLAHAVAGTGLGVTFPDLEGPAVLLVGLEAEEEAGVAFLRLRKGALRHRVRVFSVAPFASRGVQRMHGTLLPAAPGTEAEWLDGIAAGDRVRTLDEASGTDDVLADASDALRQPGAVVLVGSGSPRRPAATARCCARSPRRARASPGSRAEQASGAASRRARCPTSCRAAARSPTPRPAWTSRPCGARRRPRTTPRDCPRPRAATWGDARRALGRPARGRPRGRARARRPARPGARAPRARGGGRRRLASRCGARR